MELGGFAATRAVARGLAEHASRTLGEPLWLRDYPAAAPGDLGRVVVGLAHAGVHRTLALVDDAGAITVEVPVDDRPRLQTFTDPDAARAPLLASAAAVRRLAWPLGALDAAIGLLDHLGQALAVQDSRWRLALADDAAAIELAGEHAWPALIRILPLDGCVELAGPGLARRVASPFALAEVMPALVTAIRAAVDQRAILRSS